ncbi:hypothetical protein MRY87_08870 [bacterium]|nr:hypothetical protein [bacterium]
MKNSYTTPFFSLLLLFLSGYGGLSFGVSPAFAQSVGNRQVQLRIRFVGAHGIRQREEGARFSPEISDLQEKLLRFPYRDFRLIDRKLTTVPVAKRTELPLAHGHSLAVRTVHVSEQRVGMWLKWTGGDGMEILDSRLHFTAQEPLLTGFEVEGDRGIILILEVRQEG